MSFSEVELRVFNFVKGFLDENDGLSPTFKVIAEGVKSSTSNVGRVIAQLEAKGHLHRVGARKALKLSGDGLLNVYRCSGSIHAVIVAVDMVEAWRLLIERLDDDEKVDLARMSIERVMVDQRTVAIL